MTSTIITFVLVKHIDLVSMEDSRVPMMTYLAAEPNPGVKSVSEMSLLTVFGITMVITS